jgi:hypothetical protein
LLLPTIFVLITLKDQNGNPIPAWQAIWPVFGATNQLLAGIVLLVIAVWLKKIGKKIGFLLGPMFFMNVMTVWALVLLLKRYRFSAVGIIAGVLQDVVENSFEPTHLDHNGLGIFIFRHLRRKGPVETACKPADGDERVLDLVGNGSGQFTQGNHLLLVDQKALGLLELLMDLLQVPIEKGVLNGQPCLGGEHTQKVDILLFNGVPIVKVVHQKDPNHLSLSPEGHRGKGVDAGIATQVLTHIASHL